MNLKNRAAGCALIVVMFAFRLGSALNNNESSLVVKDISLENVLCHIEKLSEFDTRYIITDNCNRSGLFVYEYCSSLGGYHTSFHFFKLDETNQHSINIVAEKKGTNLSNETIIVFAHYDSISNAPYTQAPGANDNAAGVAILMELARILNKHPLNRTIIMIFFSGEEVGLVGSSCWINDNKEKLNSVIAAICLDGVGRGEKVGVFYYRDESSMLAEYLVEIAERSEMHFFYSDSYYSGVYGSDSGSFDAADVTVVRVWDCDTRFIHTPQDTPDTLFEESIRNVTLLITAAAYDLATSPRQDLFPVNERSIDYFQRDYFVACLILAIFTTILIVLIRRRRQFYSGTIVIER